MKLKDANIYHKILSIFPVVIIAITFTLYYPSLFGEFIVDDSTYFVNNEILTNISPLDFKSVFMYPSNNWGEFLPLRDYLFVLEYNAFEHWTTGYHIVSLVLFILIAIILYFFTKKLFSAYDKNNNSFSHLGACLVISLFLLNPMYVEIVAYISGQKDLLGLLFTILSLFYLYKAGRQSNQRFWIVFILGISFYYLGVLSKFSILPLAIFLPFLWLVQSDKNKKDKLRLFFYWFLANIPVIFWLNYNFNVSGHLSKTLVHTPFLERIPRAINIIGIHLSRIVWPTKLSLGYFYDMKWSLDLYFVIGLLFIIVVITFLFKRKYSLITLGLFLFGLFLLPVLQILPEMSNYHIYDRYLSIPLIGIFIVFSRILFKIYFTLTKMRIILLIIISAIVIFWSYLTVNHIARFETNLKLAENLYNLYPEWDDAEFKYVNELINYNQLDFAKFILIDKIQFDQDNGGKEFLLGMIYKKENNFEKAYDLFLTSSVKSNKAGTFPKANTELAQILMLRGNLVLARDILLEELNHPQIDHLESDYTNKLLNYIEEVLKTEKLK